MKIGRFIACWVGYYLLGTATAYFFFFSASYLQNSSILFAGLVFSVLYAFFFSWLYFRGVPSMRWRHRVEVIAVWLGVAVLLDILALLYIHGASLADIGITTVSGYLLVLLALFVASYITSGEHPKLSSPNLVIENKK